MIDTFNNVREVGGEMWINPLRQNLNGLWIGNGLQEQSFLDVIKTDIRVPNQGVPDDIGYIVESGIGKQLKVIEDVKEEEEEL